MKLFTDNNESSKKSGEISFFEGNSVSSRNGALSKINNLINKLIDLKEELKKYYNSENDFLENADIDLNLLFSHYNNLKNIQGNFNNDVTDIACLMAKDWLRNKFSNIEDFDILKKSASANGYDIDLDTSDGKRIIGEVKTTHLYKEKLGAKQKAKIIEDLNNLSNGFKGDLESNNYKQPDYKFMFVTDKKVLDLLKETLESALKKTDNYSNLEGAMKKMHENKVQLILLGAE